MATKLASLRAAQKNLRATFEAQKKNEWTDLTAEIEARITSEINRLHREGRSVASIMREYGTSDYRTVGDRLMTSLPVAATVLHSLVWTPVKDTTWEVTDGTHTATVVVLEDEEVVILSNTTNPEFGDSVNMEAGYQLWLNRTSGN